MPETENDNNIEDNCHEDEKKRKQEHPREINDNWNICHSWDIH